ncbi:hypothetical protein Tco_0483488 [Tanacetum coccineum]
MSSPCHPTSNIEDAFSFNFSDYIPASPDYVPASLGKTYSSSSNNSFGLVPIASPTLSLFHDDPYMKVMHAYYAKESPILPPTIVPPSSMLSPIFDNLEAELRESRTQIAKLQRKQMGINSKIALARFRIANLEQIIEEIQDEPRYLVWQWLSLPHTDSEIEALVQRLINEDKGRQDVLLNLAFQFEDSCAVRDHLRKTYEKCIDISQESRALICTLLKESSVKDRKLYLFMYKKASQLQKQMDTKSAWFQEKYSSHTHGGIGGSSSQTDFPLTEKELHQLRMDEEALKEMLEEEAMNKKAQEEKIRQEQAKNDAFFLEFGVVRYDSDCESSD